MAKRRQLSVEDRVKIQLLHEQGKSQVEIANLVKCSRCAVQSAIRRFADTGSYRNRPKTGRKRLTSGRQDNYLIFKSLKDRKKTSSVLAAELSETIGKPISARTVRRRLVGKRLKGCKARKKPFLSEVNRKNRLKWAFRYRHFTEEDWSNVVWSDESNFQVSINIIYFK